MSSFDRTYEVFAAYRLLVPLPVSVEWPSGRQTLLTEPSLGVFGADCVLKFDHDPRGLHLDRCQGEAHAHHMYRTCRWVKAPSAEQTFFERLVREGRAERLAGPFCELHKPCYRPAGEHPFPDAFFDWRGGSDLLGSHAGSSRP